MYICFNRREQKKWHNWFLDENCSHCFIIQDLKDKCLVIESLDSRIDVVLYNNSIGDVLQNCLDNYTNCVIEFKQIRNDKFMFGFNSCVGVVKKILGITKPILTPKQLKKYLINNGGTIIFKED
jgi:hypothetical protein